MQLRKPNRKWQGTPQLALDVTALCCERQLISRYPIHISQNPFTPFKTKRGCSFFNFVLKIPDLLLIISWILEIASKNSLRIWVLEDFRIEKYFIMKFLKSFLVLEIIPWHYPPQWEKITQRSKPCSSPTSFSLPPWRRSNFNGLKFAINIILKQALVSAVE